MENIKHRSIPLAFCALAVFSTGPAVAQVRQTLKNHLKPEIRDTLLVSRVPPTTQMTLSIGLVISESAGLVAAAAEIADPDSPSYRRYLTPEQFADRFGVSPEDYQAVLDWAQANHLTVTAHKNRFAATVAGSVADIEAALNLHMNYHARSDGTQFFAPDAEPSLDLRVPVEHISGLDNFLRPERAGGSGPGGTYQGTDFRNAYVPGITLTGEGQKIGIFMLDGFAQSDIDGYATKTGLSFLPVKVVPATTLTPGAEGTLDVEASLSMAPAAQIVAFVGDPTTILTNMTDHQEIKQFSSSWFWYDGTTTDTNLMLQLATQGQSFFQASGDGGAYPVGAFPKYISGSLDCRQFPYITLVGGTSLDMSGSGSSYGSLETVWPGSSGGIESSVAIPGYQSGIAGHNGASKTHRNVPDVSAQAAGIDLFWSGSSSDWVGTSESTPLWAGYLALVNELASDGGLGSVGFANPALYSIASTSAYDATFHDILSGCAPDTSGNVYCAGKGYDLATGLGSPGTALIYTLSGVQSYPLYCQGPLSTTSGPVPQTQFKWASQAAGVASPGPGECAWADRTPRGTEIKSGDTNVLDGHLHEVANLKAGKFGELGVYNDPTSHDMVVTQVVGLVLPPFSPNPTLP
jgi:subtilase family serine protease